MTDAQIDQWAALLGEDSDLIKEVRRMRAIVRQALPTTMGGYPDLFSPDGGWEAWEDRALRALSPRPDPKEDGR